MALRVREATAADPSVSASQPRPSAAPRASRAATGRGLRVRTVLRWGRRSPGVRRTVCRPHVRLHPSTHAGREGTGNGAPTIRLRPWVGADRGGEVFLQDTLIGAEVAGNRANASILAMQRVDLDVARLLPRIAPLARHRLVRHEGRRTRASGPAMSRPLSPPAVPARAHPYTFA